MIKSLKITSLCMMHIIYFSRFQTFLQFGVLFGGGRGGRGKRITQIKKYLEYKRE